MIWRFIPIQPGEINLKKGHRFEIEITEDASISFTNPVVGRVVVLKLIVSPEVKITWENTEEVIIRMNENTYYKENDSEETDVVYLGFITNKEGENVYLDCIGMMREIKNIEDLEE